MFQERIIMVYKYYIPSLPLLLKYMKRKSSGLIVHENENVIEFNSVENIVEFSEEIKKFEFISSNELSEYFKNYFPRVTPHLNTIPISQDSIKEALRFIYDELPDDVYENDTIIVGLQKLLNHVIRKNEITFIVLNIANDTLRYDEGYRYTKAQDFYFKMLKLSYNIDSYYDFFCRSQSVLRRIFVNEILFSETIIDREKQNVLNQAFNITGRNLQEFKFKLELFKDEIKRHRTTIKRTRIPVPKKYNQIEKEAILKIDETLKDVEKRIKETRESKKDLEQEIKKRHGIISLETAKELFDLIKWGATLAKP